jgi:predicted Ser/Thr protein kinase
MLKDIGKVLDRSLKKAEDNLEKAGPFIGPRGGKWADPQHKIPWKEGVPHETLTKEAHAAVKKEVMEAAYRAAAVGADPKTMKYVGAGAESITFESSGRAYKVSRWPKRKKENLRNEAEAIQSLKGTEAAHLVPKVYKYDSEHDVIVRDMVEGRPGGWGTKGLREAYEKIVAELAKKEWGHPEFKEDSFIVDEAGKNPKMIDVGFVHPRGQREVRWLERKIGQAESKADIDLLDIGFTMRMSLADGFLKPEQAKKMRAKIVEYYGTEGVEVEGFLRDLDETIKRREEPIAKAEPVEPGEEPEKLEPGDINPETGEEVPEEEEEEIEPEEEEEESE